MAHTMIAPQPGPPGVIGPQHGLQRLTETFAALETGQRQQATRDLAIRTQLTSQATALAQLGRGLRWQRDGLVGLAALGLALGGLMGWQVWHPPAMVSARALGSLEATLGQQWAQMPQGMQEQLAATSTRLGLGPPGPRQ